MLVMLDAKSSSGNFYRLVFTDLFVGAVYELLSSASLVCVRSMYD